MDWGGYNDSLVRRLLFHLPYRQLEGFTRGLTRYVDGLKTPDYSTLDRRINRLGIGLDEGMIGSDEPIYIALDSTGVKVHNSGDWMRKRFKVRKGYLKIHVAVNVENMVREMTLKAALYNLFIGMTQTP